MCRKSVTLTGALDIDDGRYEALKFAFNASVMHYTFCMIFFKFKGNIPRCDTLKVGTYLILAVQLK